MKGEPCSPLRKERKLRPVPLPDPLAASRVSPPAYGLCRFHHTIAKAARIDDEACGMLLTLLDGISYPDIHRIYANLPSDEVQLPFNSEPCLRDTVTTHCSTHRLVRIDTVSYTHLRAHETKANLVCRLLLE